MTAIKSILLQLDASPRGEVRLKAAHRLAAKLGAELVASYPAIPGALLFPVSDGIGPALLQEMSAIDQARRLETKALFDREVAGGTVQARWVDSLDELPLREFASQALYADLLVLGQRESDQPADGGLPADFVASMLIDSGKPALVVPYIGPRETLGVDVLIAWKESRESARAVAAALPILRQAERVHVATWGDDESPERRRMPELLDYLRRHGVEAVARHQGRESGKIGEYILSAAADVNADLLVMGAYGHSRARERVLGGATRTILQSMTLPVLMAH